MKNRAATIHSGSLRSLLSRNGAWLGLVLMMLTLTVLTNGAFIEPRNLTNVFRQASINGILAVGMTLVILIGGIDLSAGSVVALAGIAVGVSQANWHWADASWGAWGSLGVSMAVGLGAGVITGGLIALLGIAPFIISLGAMVIARGIALIWSNGTAISPMGDSLVNLAEAHLPPTTSLIIGGFALIIFAWVRRAQWRSAAFLWAIGGFFLAAFVRDRGIPVLSLFFLATLALFSIVLVYTTFGRSIYAIGSNERAAYLAGVPVKRVIWLVYAIMGTLSGLAGTLLTARLNSADPNAGQLFELDAIASVVIGGTSLRGGLGTLTGTLIGALVIATLNNGMDLMGVSSFYQMVFKGLIIVLAVGLDRREK